MNNFQFENNEAEILFKQWQQSLTFNIDDLDDEEKNLRLMVEEEYKTINNKISPPTLRQDYIYDVMFGTSIFNVLKNRNFGYRNYSNVKFWEYLSIKIFPDYVRARYDFDEKRYKRTNGSNANRIWLYTIWWFVNLSYDHSIDETREMLLKPIFNTDTILNLVDRKSEGYNIDLYRKIIKKFSELVVDKSKANSNDIFRFIMRLHIAHSQSIIPELYDGGIDGYVNYLFVVAGF